MVSESPLVALRDLQGLSQEKLAKKLRVHPNTVRNWERGRSEPKLTIAKMKLLCRLLKTPLHRLPDSFAPTGPEPTRGKRKRVIQLTIEE